MMDICLWSLRWRFCHLGTGLLKEKKNSLLQMGMNVRYLLNVSEVFRKCSRSAGSKKKQLLHIFNSLAIARVAEIVHQSVPGSNKISASVKVVFVSVQEINNHDTTLLYKHFFTIQFPPILNVNIISTVFSECQWDLRASVWTSCHEAPQCAPHGLAPALYLRLP